MGWIANTSLTPKTSFPAVLAALVLVLPGRVAAQRAYQPAPLLRGTLSFDGRATLGDFTGTTTTVQGEMTGGPTLDLVRGWVEAPVATLKTGNNRRDRDLNKSMESDQIPKIRFELSAVRPHWERHDSASVAMSGAFTIHGVTREATFDGVVAHQADGVRVTASLPLNLKDYAIGGLSKMLGTLKMHPDIVVRIDVVFGPGATTPPANH